MSKTVVIRGFICMLVTLLSFAALAQTQHQKDALSELSSEQIQCSAYFVVSAQCMWNSDAKALGDSYKKAAEVLSQQGFFWGKKAGLLDAVLSARMILAAKNMMGDIANSCANYSVLLTKYADSCKALAQNPVERLQTILQEFDR